MKNIRSVILHNVRIEMRDSVWRNTSYKVDMNIRDQVWNRIWNHIRISISE